MISIDEAKHKEYQKQYSEYYLVKIEVFPESGTYSSYTRYIYTTALQLEEAFDNVNVECVDVLKNPEFFREFYNTTASIIDPNSVILESGGEVRVRFRDAVKAPAPGQAAVFYDSGMRVMGGGTITKDR